MQECAALFHSGAGDTSEIQRASCLFDGPDRHAVGVDHCCFKAGMAELGLDGADVVTGLQEVGGERVAEGMSEAIRLRAEG